MKQNILPFFLCFFLFSCANNNIETTQTTPLLSINADTILHLPIQSSGNVLLVQNGASALVIDQNFCTIQYIDLKKGELHQEKHFGLIDTLFTSEAIKAACSLPNGDWILQNGYTYWIISRDLKKVTKEYISFPHAQPSKEMEENPSYKNPAIYEPDFTLPSVVGLSANQIMFPIVAEHPFFNGFNTNAFYQNAFAMAVYETGSTKRMKLLGKRNVGIYLTKKFIPSFYSAMAAPLPDGHIVIGFEADSSLYVYDERGKQYESFGRSGLNMSVDYPTHQDIEFAFDNDAQQKERVSYGRYLKLITDNSGVCIARTYSCGSNSTSAGFRNFGMQLYKEKTLMADLPLQENFQIMHLSTNLKATLGIVKNDTLTIIQTKPI